MTAIRTAAVALLLVGGCVGELEAIDPPEGPSLVDGGSSDGGRRPPGEDGGGEGSDAGADPGTDAGGPPPIPDAGPPRTPLDPPEARYHDFEEVEAFVQTIAERNPGHVVLDTYGESSAGRPLYVLKVSDNVRSDEDEPEALIDFSIHGDEIITVECGLAFIHAITERYGTDARITRIVDEHEVYIVPVVSPDSFVAVSRYVDGVDPNRDFAWEGDPSHRGIGVIAAIQSLFEAHDFAGTLDYHAFGELILMPYGGTFERPATWSQLSSVAGRMAAVGGYEPIQIATLFGMELYGGAVDYYYWRSGGLNFAIELTTDKAPPEHEIPDVADTATEMAFLFLEAL